MYPVGRVLPGPVGSVARMGTPAVSLPTKTPSVETWCTGTVRCRAASRRISSVPSTFAPFTVAYGCTQLTAAPAW